MSEQTSNSGFKILMLVAFAVGMSVVAGGGYLAKTHGDKVVVLKVNVDRERMLASMAGVRSIPDRRLFLGGRQLARAVGGMRGKALEQLVLKHEARIAPSRVEAEPIPMLAEGGPLKTLETRVAEVRGANQRQLESAASRPALTKTPGKPAAAKPSGEGAGQEGGTIEPMAEDWLPPGVTRVK